MKIPSLHTLRRIFFARIRSPLDETSKMRLEPPKSRAWANVLLGHGWSEHMLSPTFLPLAIALYQAGCNVASHDLPQHGAHVDDEVHRGSIPSYRKIVRIQRLKIFRILFSRSRGHLRTFLVVYSANVLFAMRLLQIYPLLRQGIAGVIFVAAPLRIDHNTSERLRDFLPKLMPFRNVLKRIAPHLPVSGPRQSGDPDDPHHYSGKVPLCTGVELFNAVRDVTGAGQMERLADVPCIAFIHGKKDAVAPIEDAEAAFRRIAAKNGTELIDTTEKGIVRIASADNRRVFIAYPDAGHDVFGESERVIADVIATLSEWAQSSPFTPIFFDDQSFDYDLVDFALWVIVTLLERLRANWRGIIEYLRTKIRNMRH